MRCKEMTGNENHLGELTPKQTCAIEALLKEPTTAAAAKDAKISETTLWRWLQEPGFAAAYRSARGRLLEGTLTALQSASVKAVETLRNVLEDAAAKPGEKVSAARSILEYSLKAREVLEVEERLAYLEKMLEVQETRKEHAA
jgi:hypothetical protein